MRLFAFLAIVCLSTSTIIGQTKRTIVNIKPTNSDGLLNERVALFEPQAEFLAISAVWEGAATALTLRYSENERDWSDPETLTPDPHANSGTSNTISRLLFVNAKYRFIEISSTLEVTDLVLHFFDPGKRDNNVAEETSASIEKRSCPCPQPEYLDRAGWCPAGDCPNNPSQPTTIPTHLIVHHSASANSASDWSAVVRSIWDFHVNVREWADIGYNWLIAPTGQIFEGRGDNIQGAHFGCPENPTGNIFTAGICMIGTFSTETPTSAARNSLKLLLSWKACDADIEPEGISIHTPSGFLLDHISGHRQACNTECPGNAFFPLLSEVRAETAAYISSACNGVAGPTQLETENTGTGGVEVTWTDNSEDEIAFELERSKALPNNFSVIASLDSNTTSYIDNSVDPNSGYYYRVRALTESDTSGYSNEDFIFTSPTGTTNLLDLGRTTLFPNPANSAIWLQMDNALRGEITLEAMNTINQIVLPAITLEKDSDISKIQIDLKKIPPGVYWLKVNHETGVGILPFVVD